MSAITPRLLLYAYANGIFPMAKSRAGKDLFWLDPETRGVLPLDAMHIPRRLRRSLRRQPYEVRCDTAFRAVVHGCAAPVATRPDTWINAEIERLYGNLFDMGFAHSLECWRDGVLAGGLYGVALGGAFFGESMFARERDASKIALCHLAARLALGGFRLLDTQFVTDHLRQFGAVEIPRPRYRALLALALKAEAEFPRALTPAQLDAFLQSTTQTS